MRLCRMSDGCAMSVVPMTIAIAEDRDAGREAARDAPRALRAAGARPRCCRSALAAALGTRGARRLVERPAGAAALGHLRHLRRALRAPANCSAMRSRRCARVAAGFGIGVVAGTLLGAITGYSALSHRLVDPTLQALRAIPSIAWVPLFILWFGIFEASKIILIAVGVFFPVYLGVMGAIMSVDRKIVEVGRVFRLSGFAMVRRILLPAVLPAYVLSLRVGPGPRLDVRGRGRIPRRLGGPRLSADRRPAARQAGEIVAAIVAFAILGKTTDWMLAAARRRCCAGKTGSRGRRPDADPRPRRQDLSERRARARRRVARRRARRDRRRDRRLRLRQVHAAARGVGPRPADAGRGQARRRSRSPSRTRRSASSSRSRGCCRGCRSPTMSASASPDRPKARAPASASRPRSSASA